MLKEADKEYFCEYCGGDIHIGEQYMRIPMETDHKYDFVCHCHCNEVAYLLDMFDRDDYDSLIPECFRDYISEYVYANHYDEDTEDIEAEWDLPLPELVEKVYLELMLGDK